MPVKRPPFVQNLQVLRLLTAVLVVYGHGLHEGADVFHTPLPTDPLALMNRIDIFFVISGFATFYASRGQFGTPGEAGRFMRRRLLRLVPLYWLFTLLMVLALFMFSAELAHSSFSLKHLLASMFFVPWPNGEGEMLPILILGWTLNYEMLFCVVFALALVLPPRAGIAFVVGVFVCAAAAYPLVPAENHMLKYWTDPVMLEFVFGIGLAALHGRGLRMGGLQGILLAVAGFGLLLAVTAWPERSLALRFLWAGIPAAMICAGFAFTPQPDATHRLYQYAVRLAASCYVLYLAHPFVINIVGLLWHKAGNGATWLFVPVTVVASVALAVAGHRLLEKPLNRFLDGKRAAPARPLVAAE